MIADIKEEGLGHGEKPDYFTVGSPQCPAHEALGGIHVCSQS